MDIYGMISLHVWLARALKTSVETLTSIASSEIYLLELSFLSAVDVLKGKPM